MSGQQVDPVKVAQYREREFKRVIGNAKLSAALLCYYYPNQFSLESAVTMPEGDRKLLLYAAHYQKTSDALLQLSIAAASSKPKAYKKLSNQLKQQLKDIEKNL